MRTRPIYKITLYCSESSVNSLMLLLAELKRMGNWGSSRKIHIEHWSEKSDFYFDGDGSDKIYRMEVHLSRVQTKWREFRWHLRRQHDSLAASIRIFRYGRPKTLADISEDTPRIDRKPE